MRSFQLFLFSMLIIMLQGCAFDGLVRHEKEYVYVTKYQVVEPSADMIRTCDLAPQPPEPTAYAKLSPQEKEKALHDYAAAEQKAVKNCNIRLNELQNWYVKQRKIYDQANQSEEQSKKK